MRWLAGALGVLALLALAAVALPLGMFRGLVEDRLSARFDAPVTIATLERVDWLSFSPRIRISGVKVGQPAWVGPGNFAEVDEAIVRIPYLPMLRGSFRPESIEVTGLRLNLVRTAEGRANWEARERKKRAKPTRIAYLTIRGGRLTLRDAKRRMTLDVALSADSVEGIRIEGPGTHRGQPMRFAIRGAVLNGRDPDAPYPFGAALVSPLLRMNVAGWMDHPLDLNGFTAKIRTSGDDIVYLDDVIEAGLPGTQDFNLSASVRRDAPDWNITQVRGTLGRSDLAGAVTVKKRDGRTILDGRLDAGRLDFNDLSSDAGLAKAAAKRRVTGPRVIPDTQIHFEKLAKLDGTLRVSARELLMDGPSILRGFRGTLTMDRRRLTLAPFTLRLSRGTVIGRVTVDHREGDPKLALDLRQRGTRLSDMIGGSGNDIDGPIEARFRLSGTGRDVRTAIGRSSGSVGLVMRGGSMRKKLAVFASGDLLKSIGQAIGGSESARVPVNCLVARFEARGGRLTPAPLLLDTPVGRADGTGTITLADERLALAFAGRSKDPDPLQLAATIRVDGSLSSPEISLANADGEKRESKGLISGIGNFIGSLRTKGDEGRGSPVPAANCPALAAAALK